jgi:thiamine kinase-like enzyme
MKLIRFVIISVFALVLLASAISMLFPSYVLVSRAITIERPKKEILPVVSDFQQWRSWVAGMNDSSVKVIDAKNAILGNTVVTTVSITDSLIISDWDAKGNKQVSKLRLIAADTAQQTIVQWQFEQKLKWYPWEKFGSMMSDKIIGSMMEKNLQQLKVVVEQQQ